MLAFVGNGIGAISPRLNFTTRSRICTRAPRTRISTRTQPTAMASQNIAHAVYRVGDVQASRKFLEALGMKALRERDMPEQKYYNIFYGYGPESNGEFCSLELTYNYGVDSYDIGTGFGHFGIAVEDAAAVVERVRAAGFEVVRELGPVKGGTTVMAFVKDPTGYVFEIIQRKQRDPFCQIMLRVTDLDKAIEFYEAIGMKLLRKRENPEYKYTLAFVGYGEENDSTVLELTYNWGDNTYTPGTAYSHIAVSTPDVYSVAKNLEDTGMNIVRPAGPVAGIGTVICGVRDPSGWKTMLVDREGLESEFNVGVL